MVSSLFLTPVVGPAVHYGASEYGAGKKMKIFVKVKPNAKQEKVEKIDEAHFIVNVKEPPRQGRANEAIIKALAEYFDISRLRVILVSGFSLKQKVRKQN